MPSRSKQRNVTAANMARAVGTSHRVVYFDSACLNCSKIKIRRLCTGSDVESHCEHIHIDVSEREKTVLKGRNNLGQLSIRLPFFFHRYTMSVTMSRYNSLRFNKIAT